MNMITPKVRVAGRRIRIGGKSINFLVIVSSSRCGYVAVDETPSKHIGDAGRMTTRITARFG